ncbi:hypothetical protein [Bradyrhizobium sp.]|uniref:hypothetical protein n=1 Tax=Bradyrhizobium sp. TaxID=376 RepID=UPI004037E0EF
MTNYKTLVAASLMSVALTSSAFAQCAECAMYPDRDPLNKGAPTPASKMGIVSPGGAATAPNTANTVNNPNDARAEMRGSGRTGRGTGVTGDRPRKQVKSPGVRAR